MPYKIIIIDPDKPHLAVMRKTLEYAPEEYKFRFLRSPVDVVSIMENENIDVIISELNTPIISGLETFRMCEIISPQTKKILLTDAANMPKTLEVINEVSTFGIIIKPCKLAEDILVPVNKALKDLKQEEKDRIFALEYKNLIQGTDDKYQVLRRVFTKNNADFQMIYQIIAGVLQGNLLGISGIEEKGSLEKFLQKIFLWFVLVNYSSRKEFAAQYSSFEQRFIRPKDNKTVNFSYPDSFSGTIEQIAHVFYGLYLLMGMHDMIYDSYHIDISIVEGEETIGIQFLFPYSSSMNEDKSIRYLCQDPEEQSSIRQIAMEILQNMMDDIEVNSNEQQEDIRMTWAKQPNQ